jgi:hypothetical protein
MAKKYLVASEEGAAYANTEAGSEVELTLNESDERALLCAGWLTVADKKKEAK